MNVKRPPVAGALVVLGLAALTGALAWRSRGWPLIHDAPLMHYIAWRIGEGAVPYRDLFDMNFPGVYLVHVLAFRLFGAERRRDCAVGPSQSPNRRLIDRLPLRRCRRKDAGRALHHHVARIG